MSKINSIELATAIDAEHVCEDFDPAQSFETVDQVIIYCYMQNKPLEALNLIVGHNIRIGETGFVAEITGKWCDEPSGYYRETAKLPLLHIVAQELQVAYSHSTSGEGTLYISRGSIEYQFHRSASNPSVISCFYNLSGEGPRSRSLQMRASATLSSAAMANFIFEVMEAVENMQAKNSIKFFRAIPILVYVPLTDDEDEDIRLVLSGVVGRNDSDTCKAFVAEDFETAEVGLEAGHELSAAIRSTCHYTGEGAFKQ